MNVPRAAPLELLGPLACGVQTGARSVRNVLRPEPGSTLAVFGAGGVGLSESRSRYPPPPGLAGGCPPEKLAATMASAG